MASSTSSRLSREEFRKAKELEELRKTGAAPPALDETGQIINPHIPQYIASAPWYFNQTRPGLKHQYPSKFKPTDYSNEQSINEAPRHTVIKERVSEYKAGSCANCGSMTHKVKDCLERPRARQAKHGAPVIGLNEKIIQKDLSFDAKRDRWAGYQPAEYQAVVQRHEKEEVARKKRKLQELEEQLKLEEILSTKPNSEQKSDEATNQSSQSPDASSNSAENTADPNSNQSNAVSSSSTTDAESAVETLKRLKRERKLARLRKKVLEAAGQAPDPSANAVDSDSSTDSSDDDEDTKDYGEVITKMDAKSRTTVRNLRIREDTAKYLRNLDPKSAYYDPKSRSMRDNPYPDKRPDEVLYAGDNFLRTSGEVQEINKLQRYVWDLNERSNNQSEIEIHANALPSAAEKMFIAHQQKESEAKAQAKQALLAEYGSVAAGLSSNSGINPASLMSVSDQYVEFDSEGRIISQAIEAVKPIVRSRFEEDVYDPGHTSVWGSFYDRSLQKWGYACCHQTLRRCICVGEAGKELREMVNQHSSKRKLDEPSDEQATSRLRT